MEGWVEDILITPNAGDLPTSVNRVRAIAGIGLEEDRYFAGAGTWSSYPIEGGKALTLIESEVLAAVGLSGAHARRNLVTRGIRLNTLVGRRFRTSVRSDATATDSANHAPTSSGSPASPSPHSSTAAASAPTSSPTAKSA